MLPTLVILIWFLWFYPIVGYIMGRGFGNSIESSLELLNLIFDKGAFKALVAMTQLIRYGTFNGR